MAKITTIQLFKSIQKLVTQSKKELYVIANIILLETYYHTGRLIIEHEQQRSTRAGYAKETLINLSAKLTLVLGNRFSVYNLESMRKFYMVYKDDYLKHISKIKKFEQEVRKIKNISTSGIVSGKSSSIQKSETMFRKLRLSPFKLFWSHYIFLINIENYFERRFYEIETIAENLSLRELKRQFDSALFERLNLNRNKKKVKELSKKDQVIEKPSDVIKDPYMLEFLNLPLQDTYSENNLENEVINKLQHFLLELGKGFLNVDRQKRLKMDGDKYKIDLILYHRILKCFVLIDSKIGTPKHQDLGQLQMYVN